MPDEVNNGRDRSGRFGKGEGGRPKGARNKRTLLVEQLMSDDAEAIARAVIEGAKKGDPIMARLCLDRISPAPKGRPVTFALPDDVGAAGIAEAFGNVLRAVAEGELTPEEAGAVGGLLEARRKAIETAEVVARLEALEARGAR